MKTKLFFLGLVSALITLEQAEAVTLIWSFTGATTGVATSGTPSNFSVTSFTIGNANGTVSAPIAASSVSSGYTGATGGNNIGNAFRIGALSTGSSGSGYYEVTFDPDAGYTLDLTDLDFGTRSTGTGPQSYSLRSSLDSYATSITTGTVANNSAWAYKNNTFSTFSTATDGDPITLRIYMFGGAGTTTAGTINGRLDDISITISAIPVPEPTAALMLGSFGVLCVLRRRRR